MRPTAPLTREYSYYAAGYLGVGLFGLALDLIRRDETVRSVGPFLIMAVVMVVVLGATNLRWLAGATRDAPPAPPDEQVEPPAGTARRVSLELALVGLLVLASLAGTAGIGALLSGIAFGTGAVNAAGLLLLGRLEQRHGARFHRQTPGRLIATGRRPITSRHPGESASPASA